jgi:DNA-binding MarR family transcriptional regulator
MKKNGTENLPEFAIPSAVLEQFGLLLDKGVQKLNEFQKETLGPLGLGGKHLEILLNLEEKGPMSQPAISRLLQVDRTRLAGLIDDLEKVGMVVRPKNAAGKPSQGVNLTTGGKGILSQRAPRKSQLNLLSGLTPEEQKTLVHLLRKLVISRFDAQKK